jgi:hypothetical protein
LEETKENLEKMKRYGISEGISEIILTTKNSIEKQAKKYNAAPIGIIWKNNKMFLHLFKGTNTCRNLMTEEYFAANVTDDAVLYAMSTFYDLDDDDFSTVQIEENKKKTIEAIVENKEPFENIPILKKADRYVIFKCLSRMESDESNVIDIEPVFFGKIQVEEKGQIINRGFNSVIEACVHMTRYEITKDPIFIDHIRHHFGLIQRCGRKRDKEGLAILKKRMTEIESENTTEKADRS